MKYQKKKISDYINETAKPFYDGNSSIVIEVPDFLKQDSFQTVLTGVVNNLYGEYPLRGLYSDRPQRIVPDIMYLYAMQAYKYEKLFETMNLEYNPIENYNMVEEGTDNRQIEKGSQTNQEKLGNRSDSMTVGARTDTVINSVSPYEQSDYTNKDQTTTQVGSHTDSTVTGEQSNQYIEGNRSDTDNLTHKLKRSGNIGVTTSQQMLLQQRGIADFSLYKIIATDIKNLLCNGVLN